MHNLKRDKLEPSRYCYLSIVDSKLYDQVKDSQDEKDKVIKRLLEDKAAASRCVHIRSPY